MSRRSRRFDLNVLRGFAPLAAVSVLFIAMPAESGVIRGGVTKGPGVVLDPALTITATHLESGALQRVAVVDGSFVLGDFPEGRVALVLSSPDLPGYPIEPTVVRVPAQGVVRVQLDLPALLAPTFNFQFYRAEYWNDAATLAAADTVDVTAGQTTGSINFALEEAGGTISGRVTGGGAGLPGLIVWAIGGSTEILSFDVTDANGFYQITGLPADSFLVSANALLFIRESDYAGEFYNDATSPEDADSVGVAEGADTPNINFDLALGGAISGRVTTQSDGAGIANAEVLALAPGLPFSAGIAITNAEGFYTIRGLAPTVTGSEYRVVADAEDYVQEFYNEKTDVITSDPVAVQAGVTTPNINMTLDVGATVQGTVLQEGTNAPLENLLVMVEGVPGGTLYLDFTDAAGQYSIDDIPPGDYRVSVPEIGEYYDNSPDEAGAILLTLAANEVRAGIDFVGAPQGDPCELEPQIAGSVSGRVTTDPGGAGVEGAEVSLWVDTGLSQVRVAETESDAEGDYFLECLEPGSYWLRVQAPNTTLIAEWYNNVVDPETETPTAIILPEGGVVENINVALAAGGAIAGRVTIDGTGDGLSTVLVIARNVRTDETFETLSESDGSYEISTGESGGLPSGQYIVSAAAHTTADISLTPVVLSRFEAFGVEDGIALEWAVAGDEEPVGFHVYKGSNASGEPVRLTPAPLSGDATTYVDRTALGGPESFYWLGIIDRSGTEERYGPLSSRSDLSIRTQLFGARPNPMRNAAQISFTLGKPGAVSLRIHDVSGRLVRTLVDGDHAAGPGSVSWDGTTDDGRSATRGIYYVRFVSQGVTDTRKLVVVN